MRDFLTMHRRGLRRVVIGVEAIAGTRNAEKLQSEGDGGFIPRKKVSESARALALE